MKKKYFCLMLSALLALSYVTPVRAEDATMVVGGETKTCESISTTSSDIAARVDASDGGNASLSVDNDVSVSCSDGREMIIAVAGSAGNSGSADVTVGGNIIAQADSPVATTGADVYASDAGSANIQSNGVESHSEGGYACGVSVYVSDDSSSEVSVGSNGINASGGSAEGLNVNVNGGLAAINVGGDINTQGTGNVTDNLGIRADAGDSSSISIDVAGDINTEGNGSAGAYITAYGSASVNLNVDGNINTDNTDTAFHSSGLNLQANGSNAALSARIGGDINGNAASPSTVEISTESGAKVTVVAEGTLTAGSESNIVFAGDPENISLIIWKAEYSDDDYIVKESVRNEDGTTFQRTANSEKLESSINYIIKVNASQSIDLGNTTDKTYLAPDGTSTTYNTAKEGERVAVKLTVPDGYELAGAFSDEVQTCDLLKDEEGQYYLIVPKGGGVYVNMRLVKKSDPSNNTPEQETQKASINPSSAIEKTDSQNSAGIQFFYNGGYAAIQLARFSTTGFSLDYNSAQTCIAQGITKFYICDSYQDKLGAWILLSDLQTYIQNGNLITFMLDTSAQQVLVIVNGEVVRTYDLTFPAYEDFQTQNANYGSTPIDEKTALIDQPSNTQASQGETAPLSTNNAVGDGTGGYIAQKENVQINGGKSNVTFTLAAPTSGVLSSANKYANSVGGTLLHCVTTSSPGVSFKTAMANFTVTGVRANDTISVYQLQGKNWVQVMVTSITDNHVTVSLTQHGPLAFVRVAAVATASH